METTIFTQIGFVIAAAAAISIVMHLLRQPLIMGYILTGVIVGPSVLGLIQGDEARHAFETFSEIGIALLLFIIGLGLNISVIKSLGKVSITTAAILLVAVGFTGHIVSLALGFDNTTSIIMGIALFFSSTIIILKALSDSHELGRLYGQVAIGVILVDDIVATIALVTVAMMAHGDANITALGLMSLKALGLALALYVVGLHIVPKIGKFLARSSELLFLFSIGWGLSIASLFDMAGFSHELGALFAGVSLAGLPYATEMATKLKPLRDFFIVLFFVYLGELFTFDKFTAALLPALVLSAIVMIGKPLFVMSGLGLLGYTKSTGFKAAIHLSQISEFSIILVIFAASTGLINQSAVAVITLVALITIGISTYMMKYDDNLYKRLERYLDIFERKNIKERKKSARRYPAVLFGYHKGGHEFLQAFRDMNLRYLVVDYNPDIIEHLETQGIRHAFGDMNDEEFLNEIGVVHSEIVVSTLGDLRLNMSLLKYLRRHSSKVSFICHALSYEDAAQLYDEGASYVSLPHYIGSERISNFIKRHGVSHKALSGYRDRHLITIGRHALYATEDTK